MGSTSASSSSFSGAQPLMSLPGPYRSEREDEPAYSSRSGYNRSDTERSGGGRGRGGGGGGHRRRSRTPPEEEYRNFLRHSSSHSRSRSPRYRSRSRSPSYGSQRTPYGSTSYRNPQQRGRGSSRGPSGSPPRPGSPLRYSRSPIRGPSWSPSSRSPTRSPPRHSPRFSPRRNRQPSTENTRQTSPSNPQSRDGRQNWGQNNRYPTKSSSHDPSTWVYPSAHEGPPNDFRNNRRKSLEDYLDRAGGGGGGGGAGGRHVEKWDEPQEERFEGDKCMSRKSISKKWIEEYWL